MKTYKIYYQKNPRFTEDVSLTRNLIECSAYFAHVKDIEATDLENVFYNMQGEIWSPNGEANALIQSKGLFHTSMSIGDVAYDVEEDKYYQVAMIGFHEIKG